MRNSLIESNTIDSGSEISNNELNLNSAIIENVINGSYAGIHASVLTNNSDIYGNLISGAFAYIDSCYLGGEETEPDEFGDINNGSRCYIGGCRLNSTDGYIQNIVAMTDFTGLYGVTIEFGGMAGIKLVGLAGFFGSSIQYTVVNGYWNGLSTYGFGVGTVLRDSYIMNCNFVNALIIGGTLKTSLYACDFVRTGLILDFSVLGDPYEQGDIFNPPSGGGGGRIDIGGSGITAYHKVDDNSSTLVGFAYLNIGQFQLTKPEVSVTYNLGLDISTGELILPETYRIFNEIILGTTDDSITFGESLLFPETEYTIKAINFVLNLDISGQFKDYSDNYKVTLKPGLISNQAEPELPLGYSFRLNIEYVNNSINLEDVNGNLLSSKGVPSKLIFSERTQDLVEFKQYKQQGMISGSGRLVSNLSGLLWVVSNYYTDDENIKLELVDKTINGVETKVIKEIGAAYTSDAEPTNIISFKLYYNIVDISISLVGSTSDGQYFYENMKSIITTSLVEGGLAANIISFDTVTTGGSFSGTQSWGYTYSIISASPSTYTELSISVVGYDSTNIVWSAKVEGHGVLGTPIL